MAATAGTPDLVRRLDAVEKATASFHEFVRDTRAAEGTPAARPAELEAMSREAQAIARGFCRVCYPNRCAGIEAREEVFPSSALEGEIRRMEAATRFRTLP